MMQEVVVLTIRAALSAVFIYSSLVKLLGWKQSEAEFSALGLPGPSLLHAGTVAVQLTGGLGLMTGLLTAYSAGLLACFTLAATFVAHPFWRVAGAERVRMLTTFLEHLGLAAGLILIAVTGPGRFSLDSLFS